MRFDSFQLFEKLTSDKKLPVIEALELRREELRRLLVVIRDQHELTRVQGRAEEVDLILRSLMKATSQ